MHGVEYNSGSSFMKYLIILPGIVTFYLFLGSLIAFILSSFKADITSQLLIGNVLLLFLIPTKLTNDFFSNSIPLTGSFLLASWFLLLLSVTSLSFYLFKKLR